MNLPESKLVKRQVKKFSKEYKGRTYHLKICFDDECGNKRNTFAMIYHVWNRRCTDWEEGGSDPELIAEVWPEYAKYLKWHLCSTDGPMHYIANSTYHASDKDCWGRRKGEPRAWHTKLQFEISPGIYFPMAFSVKEKFAKFLTDMRIKQQPIIIEEHAHKTDPKTFGTHYTFAGYGNAWHEYPFHTRQEAEEMQAALSRYDWEIIRVPTAWSDGKTPDLEAARNCAIWPEAALEDFTEEKLLARLPALMQGFKAAVEELGFEY